MIRRAVPEDAERLAEMHISGWRHAYRGIISDAFLFGKLNVCRRAGNMRKVLERLPSADGVPVAEVRYVKGLV